MSVFDEAFEYTVGLEGGYSDRPNDRGGKTQFGITERVARSFGYEGEMRKLPLETAKAIYRKNYWNLMLCDYIAEVSPDVAREIFDTGVNAGIGTAGLILQRSLNVLNRGGSYYPDLLPDGLIGRKTIHSLQAFVKLRGPEGIKRLMRLLNAMQGARYVEICEYNGSQEDFMYGWLERVAC